MSRIIWKSLQWTAYAIGWPLLFVGSWIVEGGDYCHDRAQRS